MLLAHIFYFNTGKVAVLHGSIHDFTRILGMNMNFNQIIVGYNEKRISIPAHQFTEGILLEFKSLNLARLNAEQKLSTVAEFNVFRCQHRLGPLLGTMPG